MCKLVFIHFISVDITKVSNTNVLCVYVHFDARNSLTVLMSSLILTSHSSLAQSPSCLKYEPMMAAFDFVKYSCTFSLVTPEPIKMGDLHLL